MARGVRHHFDPEKPYWDEKKHTGARPNDFLQALVVVVTKGQGFKAVRPSHTYHLAKSLEVLAE